MCSRHRRKIWKNVCTQQKLWERGSTNPIGLEVVHISGCQRSSMVYCQKKGFREACDTRSKEVAVTLREVLDVNQKSTFKIKRN